MEVSWVIGVPPNHHPFIGGISHNKNHSCLGYPHGYGKPHMLMPNPNSWLVYFMENPNLKWMITRGIPLPISGNLPVLMLNDAYNSSSSILIGFSPINHPFWVSQFIESPRSTSPHRTSKRRSVAPGPSCVAWASRAKRGTSWKGFAWWDCRPFITWSPWDEPELAAIDGGVHKWG